MASHAAELHRRAPMIDHAVEMLEQHGGQILEAWLALPSQLVDHGCRTAS
jgi:hypothetical protein